MITDQSMRFTTDAIVVADPTKMDKGRPPARVPPVFLGSTSVEAVDSHPSEEAPSAIIGSPDPDSGLDLPSLASIIESIWTRFTSDGPTRTNANPATVAKFARIRAAVEARRARVRQAVASVIKDYVHVAALRRKWSLRKNAQGAGDSSSGSTSIREFLEILQEGHFRVDLSKVASLAVVAVRRGRILRRINRVSAKNNSGGSLDSSRTSRIVLNGIKKGLLVRDGSPDISDDADLLSLVGLEGHPGPSLKVGQDLVGGLTSPSGAAMVHASRVNGAMRFTSLVKDSYSLASGPPGMETETLFAPHPSELGDVVGMREAILDDYGWDFRPGLIFEGFERGLGGKTDGKLAAILRFQPYGKHGSNYQGLRQQAIDHFGQTSLSITDRGVLEGKVDGRVVWRFVGPSSGYRPKDSSYELWVTDTGIHVTRGGQLVWGVIAKTGHVYSRSSLLRFG